MIFKLTHLIYTGLALVSGAGTGYASTLPPSAMMLPSDACLLTSPDGKRFIQLSGGYNHCQAQEVCKYLGAQLSDIKQGPEVTYLAKALNGTAWINSWDGNPYEGTPLAFFPGGAMARPDENGESLLNVLCDLPDPCQGSQPSA